MKAHDASLLGLDVDRGVDLAGIGERLEAQLASRFDAVRSGGQRPLATLSGKDIRERGFMGERLARTGQPELEVGDLDVRVAGILLPVGITDR